ncbi:carbohydrate esterase family 4 protein [Boletus coccyginus]|nr:carbohydrate esterase family 4 protein [Boletus coccyginus]
MRSSPLPASLPALILAAILVPSASAQDRTTEQGEAAITDPNVECTPYYFQPVGDAMDAGQYPPLWTVADIIANDVNANAKYQSIQSQILNIPPNDLSGSNYPDDDPNCWWTYSGCTTPKHAGLSPDQVAVPEPNTLGYGFDDGPNCSHNAFYDYLQQNNQKATMFYIGSNVADWPLEAQRALADGHEICVRKCPLFPLVALHADISPDTWSHNYMTTLTNTQAFAELYYGKMQMIKLVVGVTPTCWRPPYGDVDDRVRSIAQALGLRDIMWTYDSNDWEAGTGGYTDADVDANYQALVTAAQQGTFNTGGTIILAHELSSDTMGEAMKWYPQLKSVFKYLVPMGTATNVTHPYVETNYLLPTFAQYTSGSTVLSGASELPTSSTGEGSNPSGGEPAPALSGA